MERPQADDLNPDAAPAEADLFFRAGELRAFWRIVLFVGLYLPALFGVMLLLQAAPPDLQYPGTYLFGQHAVTFLVTALILRRIERKPFAWIGLGLSRHALRQVSTGILIAAVLMTVVALLEIASGAAVWRIGAPSVDLASVWIGEGAVSFFVIGFGEELLFRGYCFQSLLRGTNAWVAIVLSSSVFALMHVWNPHITLFSLVNVGLAGAFFGLAYLRAGTLWLPAGMHWAWNFFQGTIYGFPVSGLPARSLFLADAQGPSWLSGGAFGPEGGAFVTLALGAGIIIFLLPGASRRLLPAADAPPKEQETETEHA